MDPIGRAEVRLRNKCILSSAAELPGPLGRPSAVSFSRRKGQDPPWLHLRLLIPPISGGIQHGMFLIYIRNHG